MIVTGCRYERGGVSPPSQEERIQLDEKSDGVCDIAEPMRYQGEKLPLSGRQEVASIQADCSGTKESISIKMRKDRSLQLKGQLARAMESLSYTERQLTGLNSARTAAVATKFHTPPALELGAHKDKKGYDRLLLKRWTCKVDWGPGAKTIWGRNIPEILPFTTTEIMFGFVPKWKIVDGYVQKIRPDFQSRERSPFTLCFLTFS